jgi:2-C-methyl-D-erythritol 4-phosphate cytidylyltransferase
LVRSVELFLNRDNVKQIQVVFNPDALEDAKRKFGGHFGFAGVKVLSGGPKWTDQLAAAAEKISPDATHVIIHDAARPVVPYTDIDTLMEAAEKASAATLVTPVRSSLIEVDEADHPLAAHSPDRFQQLLTPRAFSKEKYLALAKSKQELHASEWTLVKGSALNVRVGGPGDEKIAKAMLAMLPKKKVQASSPFEEAQW